MSNILGSRKYYSLFFLYALPVFFVLNGWGMNREFIPFNEISILLLYYLSGAVILHLLFSSG